MRRCRPHIRVVAGILALSAGVLGVLRIGHPGPQDGAPDGAVASVDSSASSCAGLPLLSLPVTGNQELAFRPVVVTGYASRAVGTDSTPSLTASMTRASAGCIALSRDLLRTFTPGAPFDFGDCVVIPSVGVFSVEDTMHPRWTNRADIWFEDPSHAMRWGCREALIARLPSPIEESSPLFASSSRVRYLSGIAQQ